MHPHSHSGRPSGHQLEVEAKGAGGLRADTRVELVAVLLAIAAIGSEPLGDLRGFLVYVPLTLSFVWMRERALVPAFGRYVPAMPVLLALAAGFPLSHAMDGWLDPARVAGEGLPAWRAAGWDAAASLFLRASCAVTLLSTLVHTAGFPRILDALRRIGLPAAVVLTLQHMERYRALLAEEWNRTNQAREARSPGGLRFALPSYANQTGLVFLRSWERSERIHAAMLSRGFRLDLPFFPAVAPVEGAWRAFWHSAWLPLLALLIRLAV